MTHVAVRQGTDAWLEARRSLVTATDIPVLLGLSPWKCEAGLADEKLTGTQSEPSLRMRVGSAVQDLIGEEYSRQTGRRVRRYLGLITHPTIEWAGASPDFRVVGERRLMEAKRTSSRSRFADGLPQDVEAQVAWQLGVTGYHRADVAVLVGDDELSVFEVEANARLFDDLLAIASDFRTRLAAGGPFAEDAEYVKARYPQDNGTVLPATPDLVELVDIYRSAKVTKVAAEDAEKTAANALRAILRDAGGIDGLVTYRKNADSTRTNWPAVASTYRSLLAGHADDELDAIVSIHSETAQGPRVLRLLKEKAE